MIAARMQNPVTLRADLERAVEAVLARAKTLEPTYDERLAALRSHKAELLAAKRKGLSVREIHRELSKNLPYRIDYRTVLTVLHEAEKSMKPPALGKSIVSRRSHQRPR